MREVQGGADDLLMEGDILVLAKRCRNVPRGVRSALRWWLRIGDLFKEEVFPEFGRGSMYLIWCRACVQHRHDNLICRTRAAISLGFDETLESRVSVFDTVLFAIEAESPICLSRNGARRCGGSVAVASWVTGGSQQAR